MGKGKEIKKKKIPSDGKTHLAYGRKNDLHGTSEEGSKNKRQGKFKKKTLSLGERRYRYNHS